MTARSGLGQWLDDDRWAALHDAVEIPGFRAADGLFVADAGGVPDSPADLIDPLRALIDSAERLLR